MNADAYLFDIDGTLVVTRDLVHWNGLCRAMREAYGVETTIEGIAYHGKTDVGILRAALERCGISGSRFEQNLPFALAVICREVAEHAQSIRADVCPAVPDLLASLRRGGKLLGVASGNLETVGWHKLKAARLREFFSFGSFGDRFEARAAIFDHALAEARRRLGTQASVCFLGDTPADIDAARQVGAAVAAISTGIFSRQELAACNPDLCCSSCAELLGHLQ